jgi:arylsulfatase
MIDRAWLLVPAQAFAAQMLQSLAEFPPSQKPASFTIDKLMERLEAGMPSS